MWLRDGKLVGRRLGGRRAGWRIRASDLDRFLTDDSSTSAGE
ncbi:MAG: hypothetical protein AB7U18_00130 [Dehalococcoidia bacterium]